MKISFGNSVDKVNKPPLKIQGGYVKVQKLSDEQVKQINDTRMLPDGYYLGAHKGRGRGDSGPAYLNIEKDKKGWDDGFGLIGSEDFYTPILPKGYAVQNVNDKTYLKEEGVDINKKKANNLAAVLLVSLAGALAIVGLSARK